MAITETTLNRLHTGGYTCVTDGDFAKVAPWIRFAFIGCATLVALGVALQLPVLLWAMVPVAATSALMPYHVFDLVYNHFVRRFTGTPPIPRQGAPRRFACALASVWLIPTGLAFYLGMDLVGYALGAGLLAIAGLVSTTYICIPSIIYGFIFGKPLANCA